MSGERAAEARDGLLQNDNSTFAAGRVLRIGNLLPGRIRHSAIVAMGCSDASLAGVSPAAWAQSLSCAYNGMFPCFFGGLKSRLLRSMPRALMMRARVSRGSITSST